MSQVSTLSAPCSVSPSAPSCFVGIDVAKAELVIAISRTGTKPLTIANRERNVRRWLKTLPMGSALIVESTGIYHRLVCNLAFELGFTVYLINPFWLRSYRNAQGKRAKTDRCDAELLAQYGEQNHRELRPYQPASPEEQRLTQLLRGRSQVVSQQVAARQSLASIKENRIDSCDIPLEEAIESLLQDMANLIAQFDRRIGNLLQSYLRWNEQSQRLRQIPGLGPLSVASLLAAFERGAFETAQSFVAYLGLDPVARDSGTLHGKRRISKKGDPMVRKTLYMAATAAMRTRTWKEFAARYKDRGLHHTQVACIVARRIAITAWCLLKRQTEFKPERLFRIDPYPQT